MNDIYDCNLNKKKGFKKDRMHTYLRISVYKLNWKCNWTKLGYNIWYSRPQGSIQQSDKNTIVFPNFPHSLSFILFLF